MYIRMHTTTYAFVCKLISVHLYTCVQVNTNGVISFKRPLNLFTVTSFIVDNEDVIAPYWTDIDITYTGNVFFRESTEDEILDEITNEIRNVNYLRLADFKAYWAFIVTWDQVVQNSNFSNNQKVY